uniref:Lipocalin n=1 Tax=Rhipicephalus zambeziensis TaxID=60191 RepID=A0A224YMK1_9ACAR
MYRYINSAITFIVFFNVLRWSNSELDLKKFLNTSSRIWTYYSTQNRTLFCLNDIKVEMTDKSVVLNRSYYEGEEWNSTMMEWVFFENISDKRGAYVCMHHNDLVHHLVVFECIKYQNETRQCAVMKYRVVPFQGQVPPSSVHYSPLQQMKPKEDNMTVFEWHELQTLKPDDPVMPDNDCLDAFNNLSKVAIAHKDYNPGCTARLYLMNKRKTAAS